MEFWQNLRQEKVKHFHKKMMNTVEDDEYSRKKDYVSIG